jgi:predicted CoA-substrate-specific enzyme activase
MTITAGIDVGSTYTKCVLVRDDGEIVGRALAPTGFKLAEISRWTFTSCLEQSKLREEDVSYVIATGIGRHQVGFKDIHVTDLTAGARGARALFAGTRTVLDVGGQTMKASRLDESSKVISFRLNDKCAAGTGAFLEKTARYMGFEIEEIGPLLNTSKEPVPISGVCAVFAESEVINHLSMGTPPADIMQGAVESLVGRSAQLIRRVKAQPQYTLIGGILRFDTFADAVRRQLESDVNVPDQDMVQFVSALGAALLGQRRIEMLARDGGTVSAARSGENAS